MGSPNKRVLKSLLKQGVIYQGMDASTGIVVSRKSKIIRKQNLVKNC